MVTIHVADLTQFYIAVCKQFYMKISVIITSYNYADYLPQAVESALNQVECDQEVIIVDDGSTDDSPWIAKAYAASDARVRSISKANGGQGSAFNAGYAAARGDIIAFLDADDFWYPDKLRTVQGLHNDWGMVQHNLLINGDLPFIPLKSGSGLRCMLFKHGYAGIIPTSGLSFSRWVLEKIFPIPEKNTEICADLYIKYAGLIHSDMWTVDENLGHYRVHDHNYWYLKGNSATQPRIIDMVNQYARSIGHPAIPATERSVSNALAEDINLLEGRPYVIYGAGTVGGYMHDHPKFSSNPFWGFVDSDPAKWGTFVNGVEINPPQKLNSLVESGAVIIIASMYCYQILRDLKNMGFREGEDIIVPRI